jgi:hypothetical protein
MSQSISLRSRGVIVLVFNVTFNNISVMSSRSVLLLEESGVPGENYLRSSGVTDVSSCYHKIV